MKFFLTFFLLFLANYSFARDRIRGIGTPLLFPSVIKIADELREKNGMPSPFIEIGATGISFQIFCSGVGERFPDIVNSSREMSEKESALCQSNGIKYDRITLEYDAIILIGNKDFEIKNVTDKELFLAISAYVFDKNGYLKLNDNKKWRAINSDFPDTDIIFYGTTITSGTYDFLKEKIFKPECAKVKEDDPFKKYCGLARMDGRYVPVPGGYTMNIQKMLSHETSMAMIPLVVLEKNAQRFKTIGLNGMIPNETNIKSYFLSRPMFVYYKKNSIDEVVHFSEFVGALLSRAVDGG